MYVRSWLWYKPLSVRSVSVCVWACVSDCVLCVCLYECVSYVTCEYLREWECVENVWRYVCM